MYLVSTNYINFLSFSYNSVFSCKNA